MFVFRMLAIQFISCSVDPKGIVTLELWKYMCNILGANFLHNRQSIMCDNEVLKCLARKLLSIFLQTAEEVFPALEEDW
jgi:hypothetical protein